MKILITGGAGFVGSNLTDYLLKQGNEIIIIDNFDSFYDPQIKRSNIQSAQSYSTFKLIEGDIRDKSLLKICFQNNKIDLVIHLAARAGVRPSILNPELYYDVNLNGTLCLLETMREFGVKKLIFASSSSVYGDNTKVPFSESDNVDRPISPYAASKKAGELICHTYHKIHQFDIFCLRFFTVFGPRQRPEMAIHSFAKKIINEQPIPFFGDGSSKRDYTFVDDIISGIVGAISHLKGYEIINLGESNTISLSDLIYLLEKCLDKKAILNRLPMQPGDVSITYADISKAKQMLNYHPQMPIDKGLPLFIDWFLKNKN